MILSVGYRVNSKNATAFRIWTNRVLKDYLIKGYAVNRNVKMEQLDDLKKTVKLLSNVIEHKELTAGEATGLLNVITDYAYALDTLDRSRLIENNTLVALTLMIAESRTEEKDIIVKVVVNLINKNN
jgi:hypothetical protein